MKAMILVAGLGTRLLPLTAKTPKPLFPILGRPLLDIIVKQVETAGFRAIIMNTHHLGPLIERFLSEQRYPLPVAIRHEPQILGTGGGIKNVEDLWDDEPLLVVNGDIFTDIDLGDVYRFHLGHECPVTLVLHDAPQFNNVWVDPDNRIMGFGETKPCPPRGTYPPRAPNGAPDKGAPDKDGTASLLRRVAYTGIQVLNREVLDFIPRAAPSSIIDAFCSMIAAGRPLQGFEAKGHFWHDIGSFHGYRGALKDAMARRVLQGLAGTGSIGPLTWAQLHGDGSDRLWYRAAAQGASVVVVDHGPPPEAGTCEADAFYAIGQHLHRRGVAVPAIYDYERPFGLLAVEDVGDLHLQAVVRQASDPSMILQHYRRVIDLLVGIGVDGARGFDPRWTYQTVRYDQDLILEREAKYFVEAFLAGYLGLSIGPKDLKEEFEFLARRSLATATDGFIHRDFQSRNILVKNGKYYALDYQGGRLGPLQYDLASLLIDPYVELPQDIQAKLLEYYMNKLSEHTAIDRPGFVESYRYCAINRNLQILGAFGFLSRVKGKRFFEAYIPAAVRSLRTRLRELEPGLCDGLKEIVNGLEY